MGELITLERRGWEALSTGGAQARSFYAAVLAEEVRMLLPGGLLLSDRTEILDSMSGQPWSRFELTDEQALTVSPEVVVVTYRATAQREGQPEYVALCASTYVRRVDTWELCVHQQTPE